MKSNYLSLKILTLFLVISLSGFSQEQTKQADTLEEDVIENLTIFPNPITNGKVYINSKLNLKKDIEIYDVLGKKVVSTQLMRRELDVSKLTPGVYIMKISENNKTATRKLVIR